MALTKGQKVGFTRRNKTTGTGTIMDITTGKRGSFYVVKDEAGIPTSYRASQLTPA